MFEQLRSFALNPNTQSEIKAFLQEYHKHISEKHQVTHLKLGKALNSFASVMGDPSWNHFVAKTTEPATPNKASEVWSVQILMAHEGDEPELYPAELFQSEDAAYQWVWKNHILVGLTQPHIKDGFLRKLGVEELPETPSLTTMKDCVHFYFDKFLPKMVKVVSDIKVEKVTVKA